MDGLGLLAKAQAAGVTVEVAGENLVLRGPKRAEAIARELIQQKAAVLAVLAVPPVKNFGDDRHDHHDVEKRHEPERTRTAGANAAGPRTIIVHDTVYDLKQIHGMWFFQMQGHPEAGWSCCDDEFVKLIEDTAGRHR